MRKTKNGAPPRLTERNIINAAIELGLLEGPGEDLAPVEARMLSEAALDVRQCIFERNSEVSEAHGRFSRACRALANPHILKTTLEPCFTAFRQVHSEVRPAITRACHEEQAAKRNFTAYCRRHKRKPPARYSDHPTRYWLGHAGAVFALEVSVNASLFADQLQAGLIESLALSVGVSGVSVALAYAGAELSRNCNHTEPARRLVGCFGAATAASLLFTLHLNYAQFRTLIGDNALPTFGQTMAHVFGSGLLNLSFQGALLLGVGLAASALVWHRVYRSSDPYPGYAAEERALRAAQKSADRVRGSLVPIRQKQIADAREATGRALASATAALGRMKESLEMAEAADTSCAHRIDAIQNQLSESCALFWNEIAAIRVSKLPERAFKSLRVDDKPEPVDLSEMRTKVEEAERLLAALQQDVPTRLAGFDSWMELMNAGLLAEADEAARSLREPVRDRSRADDDNPPYLEVVR